MDLGKKKQRSGLSDPLVNWMGAALGLAGGVFWGREDLWDPQETGAEGQGRLPHVFCCRAGNKIAVLEFCGEGEVMKIFG